MNIHITADPHLGHSNIIKYCHRPFLNQIDKDELARRGGKWHDGDWKRDVHPWRISDESVELMNDALINNTNAQVASNDVLYCVGDFGMQPKDDRNLPSYYQRCKKFRDKINCQTIHLIHGNHDHPIISDLFTSYSSEREIEFGRTLIVLHHYAHVTWNRSHRGSWHLYGHSHSEIETWMDTHMPGRRSFDAGVDNAAKVLGSYRPFRLDTDIVRIMSTRTGHSLRSTPNE